VWHGRGGRGGRGRQRGEKGGSEGAIKWECTKNRPKMQHIWHNGDPVPYILESCFHGQHFRC